MNDVSTLNENDTDAARSGLLRLHDAVSRREAGRPEAALSPDELLSLFRAADPTRNAACLPWLLRTYAAGGYRLEDLSKAHDTLVAFVRVRGQLPNTATIDGEVRNPRKLGSHVTLASLWTIIAPLVEAERLAQEDCSDEKVDTDRERALAQSRVIHRSARTVIAVPMTVEASCWWGQGTQWCTAARNNNAFEQYHKKAPLIVVCLRKSGYLPARKLQLHVYASDMQFMDENDAPVSLELVSERWQDLEVLLHWALSRNGRALAYFPKHLRTGALCLAAVVDNGLTLKHVPVHLRTGALCLAAVGNNGDALAYVPEHLHTEAISTAAVGRYGEALYYVPNHLRTEAMCLAAVSSNGSVLQHVPESLRTEAMCLAAVGKCGRALECVPEPLRTEAICMVAVEQYGIALDYIPEFLRTETICTVAVEQDGWALQFVPEPLRTEALCTAAVEQDGGALRYVPEHLRTEEMCIAAVGSDGIALYYVPEHLRTEAECLAAVTQNGLAMYYVPKHMRTKAICLAAVTQHIEVLHYVPEPLRTEVMRLTAAGGNKQKSVSVTGATNERELHKFTLESLEGYLNKLQHGHQETVYSIKSGIA